MPCFKASGINCAVSPRRPADRQRVPESCIIKLLMGKRTGVEEKLKAVLIGLLYWPSLQHAALRKPVRLSSVRAQLTGATHSEKLISDLYTLLNQI